MLKDRVQRFLDVSEMSKVKFRIVIVFLFKWTTGF